jgi:hypothetical protein
MGLFIETGDDRLGLEIRRKSIVIHDLLDPGEGTERSWDRHIFPFVEEGSVEISKDFLRRLLTFFDTPEHRVRWIEGRR